MKKLTFTLAMTMLATHLLAPPVQTASLFIATLDDGRLQIIGSGSGFGFGASADWVLQSTTDFTNWTPISTNVFVDSITVTNIIQPTNSMMFYRVEASYF